ncbi:unnamed protein product [Protopolystoma xenopodis]|uniref:Uncharacterized protein n=1 Tax=Protopolystoma xenopodis TaxID=117903 RepID=A0A3S5A416_9PLAT|nr:unnamed protein product [Protopolystoma xenopodis]
MCLPGRPLSNRHRHDIGCEAPDACTATLSSVCPRVPRPEHASIDPLRGSVCTRHVRVCVCVFVHVGGRAKGGSRKACRLVSDRRAFIVSLSASRVHQRVSRSHRNSRRLSLAERPRRPETGATVVNPSSVRLSFTLSVRLSVSPSLRLSVRPSVRPSAETRSLGLGPRGFA